MRYLIALLLTFGVYTYSAAQVDQNTNPQTEERTDMDQETEDGYAREDFEAEQQFNQDLESDAEFQMEQEQGEADLESDFELQGEADTDLNAPGEVRTETETEVEFETEAPADANADISTDIGTENLEDNNAGESDYIEAPEIDAEAREMEMEQEVEINNNVEGAAAVDECETAREEGNEDPLVVDIVQAPFKAGVTLLSETGEGVIHIVGAPFKAVGKLFGGVEHDDRD